MKTQLQDSKFQELLVPTKVIMNSAYPVASGGSTTESHHSTLGTSSSATDVFLWIVASFAAEAMPVLRAADEISLCSFSSCA